MSQQNLQQGWYKPGKSISQFHRSKAKVRALIGARGTGKTTSIAVEALGHGFHIAGAKIYILRKTQDANRNTTQETFEQVFKQCGSAYIDTGLSLFKKIEGGEEYRIPSAEAVKLFNAFMRTNPNKTEILHWLNNTGNRFCSFIHFAGVPTSGVRDTRFRGYECSMLIFVEADQLEEDDLRMARLCLRWKDAYGKEIPDTCCILDTNPPSPNHWIAQMEFKAQRDNDASVQFWHIAMEENEHNLPAGYVDDAKKIYADNVAMYNRMVLGLYDDAFEGKRVLWAFRSEHVYADLPWPKGAYLVRGWDFGTTQAVTWSAYWNEGGDEYWWDLYEYFATQSDVETQCREVARITSEVFPYWNDRSICAGVMDFCDPAGFSKTDKGASIEVLNKWGFFPGRTDKYRSLQLGLAVYNRLLEKKDRFGRFVYRICRNGCHRLYLASLGGYRYPNKDEPGSGKDEPGKGPKFGDCDHIADASRYAKIYCLRLTKAYVEETQKRVGLLAKPTSPNPLKKWR